MDMDVDFVRYSLSSEKIDEFVKDYNPMTRIAYDGLYETNYKYEDGYGYFEQGSADSYSSLDEITKDLK